MSHAIALGHAARDAVSLIDVPVVGAAGVNFRIAPDKVHALATASLAWSAIATHLRAELPATTRDPFADGGY